MQTTPWVTRLLAANVAIFFVFQMMPALTPLERELVLVPAAVLARPWTPFTYMWLHAGFGHLFFNMLALYFFGPRLEQRLGSTHFLALYLVSGLGGAALSFINPLAPGVIPMTAIVGASGAIYGVILAYAMIWPQDRVMIWGVFPTYFRVSWEGHLFGFLGGVLAARLMTRRSPPRVEGARRRV